MVLLVPVLTMVDHLKHLQLATEPHQLLQNMAFLRKKLEMHMELLQIVLVLSTAFQLQIQLTQGMPHLLIRVMVHHPRLQEMSTGLLQAMIASIMEPQPILVTAHLRAQIMVPQLIVAQIMVHLVQIPDMVLPLIQVMGHHLMISYRATQENRKHLKNYIWSDKCVR